MVCCRIYLPQYTPSEIQMMRFGRHLSSRFRLFFFSLLSGISLKRPESAICGFVVFVALFFFPLRTSGKYIDSPKLHFMALFTLLIWYLEFHKISYMGVVLCFSQSWHLLFFFTGAHTYIRAYVCDLSYAHAHAYVHARAYTYAYMQVSCFKLLRQFEISVVFFATVRFLLPWYSRSVRCCSSVTLCGLSAV